LVTIGNFDAMRYSSEIASFAEMGNVGLEWEKLSEDAFYRLGE